MKKWFIIAFLFISFAIILNVSSSFEKGSPNFKITNQYSQEDSITGWVNISFKNETTNSSFTDSFNNSIKLIKLLKLNNDSNYKCSPSDCKDDYSSTNPESKKTFSLNKGQSKIIGIKLTGENLEKISDFSMNVSSSALESEVPQLYIDILNNGKFEWRPYKPANNFYDENYGCYTPTNKTVLIYNEPYCEKISIPATPNAKIGADIIKETGGNVNFYLSFCDENYTNCNYCKVTASTSRKVSCIFNGTIEKRQNFFVCINTKNIADNNKYKINSETINPCGFASVMKNKRDFKIFAEPGKYSAIGEFKLDNNELQNAKNYINLKIYIKNYLKRYNDSCTNGCIIPIRFTANEPQTITVSNAKILYTISGTPKIADKIYDLREIPAKISSGFQKIYLNNANFSVSRNFGENINYSLSLNNKKIFSDEISIERVPQITSLFPKVVIAAYPTKFIVNTEQFNSSGEIKDYNWNFGDGNTVTTIKNEITHTYNSTGSYNLKITISNSNSFNSSKTFNITAKSPKEAINFVLKNKLNELNNVTQQINNLPLFYKTSLSKTLNISEIQNNLSSLQQRNATAVLDSDYVSIMKDLINLKIPTSIFQSKIIESAKFYPNEKDMSLETLQSIAGGNYTSETKENYKKSILLWDLKNTDIHLTSKDFSAVYEGSTKKILSFFKIEINKNQNREDSYFIISKLDNLKFKDNYQEKEIGNYIYIKLTPDEKTIEFSTTQDIGFSELPAFISPPINELPIISEKISESKNKFSKLTILIFAIIFAFFVGLVTYIILQEWYKRKYENYLFKNKNNLYNMVSYIESAKKRGLKDKEIKMKLKKVGWNSEQIRYVMKKYVGKRTGMLEIPVGMILNLFKKKKNPIQPSRRVQLHPPNRPAGYENL